MPTKKPAAPATPDVDAEPETPASVDPVPASDDVEEAAAVNEADSGTPDHPAPAGATRREREETEKLFRALYPDDADLYTTWFKDMFWAMPRLANVTPTRQWLRQIYALSELAQTFEWMNLAKWAQPVQDQTDLLSDDEYRQLFNAWMSDSEVEPPK